MSAHAARLSAALEGRYRIERELGAGGMATVHLARDLRHDREAGRGVQRVTGGSEGKLSMHRADRPQTARPAGIVFLAVVNYVACGVTLVFWSLVFFGRLVPAPGSLPSEAERADAAVTYGFMLGDVLYSAPLLLLAGMGLWRRRPWGWLAAQMANALWVYSMTVILLRDFYSRWSPGGLLFAPFAIIALWAVPYLWKVRRDFRIGD